MCINLIGKLAIEERHRRASLWVQPSISETDATKNLAAITPNLDTVASPVASLQCQPITEDPSELVVGLQSPPTAIIGPQHQNQAMVASPVASSQYQQITENPSALVGSQSPPTAIISPQNQKQAMVPSPVTSSQYQPITENPSALVGSQSPPTAIISPQNQKQAMVPSPVTSSQYQPITENPSALVGSQSPQTAIIPQNQNQATVPSPVVSSQYVASPTAIINPEVQTTPSVLNIQQQTFPFHDPAISQSGSEQPPRADSPMTQFLNSTSGLASYNWGGDTGMSMSFNPSEPFDFSGMISFSAPSSDSGPLFGMDPHWKTNTLGANLNASDTSLLDPIAPAIPTLVPPTSSISNGFTFSSDTIVPMSNTTDSALHSAFPTSAPPTSTITDGFIPANSTVALNTATNTLRVSDGTRTVGKSMEVDDNSKKRKSYEEQNAHCILPEGSHRARKSRRVEGAEEENTAGPKKRNTNTNKKGKGSKGKK